MKKFISLFIAVVCLISCRDYMDPLKYTAGGKSGTEPSGSEPSGTEPSGPEPSGPEPSGPEPGGTEPGGSDSSNLDKLDGYFVRPKSGGSISLTPAEDSEIWYMFTSTAENATKPNFSIEKSKNEDSVLKYKTIFDSSANKVIPDDYIAVNPNDLNLIKKNEDNSYPKSSPKGDVVGNTYKLWRAGKDKQLKQVDAICRVNRTVKTANGNRTLLIYEEEGCKGNYWPTTNRSGVNEWEVLADYFLKDGLSNDIYDKVTSLVGNDHGFVNSETSSQFIDWDDTITLFYCDVYDQGDVQGGTLGYCYPGDFWNSTGVNARAIVYIHGYASGGSYLGENLTTIAHEFTHLVWSQYHLTHLTYYGIECAYDNDNSVTETFAGMVESYIARFLYEQNSSYGIRDPFLVNYKSNPKRDNGYLIPFSYDNFSVINCLIQGRGREYLNCNYGYNIDAWRGDYNNYGLVASFGLYLLTNYGPKLFKAYNEVRGDNLEGIKGFVAAINKMNNSDTMTVDRLIADWGTADMLSNVPTLATPYSVYRQGWITINDCKVPSVNYWLYSEYDSSAYKTKWEGFQSSDKTSFTKNANTMYKVKSTQNAGTTYSATAPILPSGVTLTVVAVPKTNRNCN